MRKGIQTTEFWIGVVMALLAGLQKALWPEHPIPNESFVAVVAWIGARLGQKAISDVGAKRPWVTTEFWAALAYAVAKYVFPGVPEVALYTALTYVVGRPAAKGIADFRLATPRNRKIGPQT